MKFKELLFKNNKSQKRLASELNVTQQLISKWVNGICQPQLEMVRKLATILNVSTDEILSCFLS